MSAGKLGKSQYFDISGEHRIERSRVPVSRWNRHTKKALCNKRYQVRYSQNSLWCMQSETTRVNHYEVEEQVDIFFQVSK